MTGHFFSYDSQWLHLPVTEIIKQQQNTLVQTLKIKLQLLIIFDITKINFCTTFFFSFL